MYYPEAKEELLRLLATQAYEFHPEGITLRSGKVSNHYIDARRVTLTAAGARCIGLMVAEYTRSEGIEGVGGPSIGADPIVAATLACHKGAWDLKGFLVRAQAKDHGKEGFLVGPALCPGERVFLVEDTVTTGGSLQHAIDVVRETGVKIERVIVLVDREEGARERLAEQGLYLQAFYTMDQVAERANRPEGT